MKEKKLPSYLAGLASFYTQIKEKQKRLFSSQPRRACAVLSLADLLLYSAYGHAQTCQALLGQLWALVPQWPLLLHSRELTSSSKAFRGGGRGQPIWVYLLQKRIRLSFS